MMTFIDNVEVLVVENCLVKDLAKIFPEESIWDMTDSDLKRFVYVLPETQREQKALKTKIDSLKASLQVLQKNVLHSAAGKSSFPVSNFILLFKIVSFSTQQLISLF